MIMMVGLGNPGRQFKNTPHNLGFEVIDRIRKHHRFPNFIQENQALVSRGKIEGHGIILVKPLTFMNESGKAVSALVKKYEIVPTQIWLAHDDTNLSLGEIKTTQGRGPGGHKGVTSIIEHLGSKDFYRIRLGASLEQRTSLKEFVLRPYSLKNRTSVRKMVKKASEVIIETIKKTGS